jgi:hypothetical protein
MAKPSSRPLRRTPLGLDHYVLSVLLATMAGLSLLVGTVLLLWPR